MTIWLTSDSHFGHAHIYHFVDATGQRIRHRFRDAHEGDAYMCQRWCELVRPEDHIYHLGDVTMERSSNAKSWFVNTIRSLPGHKRLILGNHDHLTMDIYKDAGFQKIKGSHLLNDGADKLLLTHYPIHESSIPSKFLANAHGHTHAQAAPSLRHINMSVEVWDYEPVPMEVVLQKARQQYARWAESRLDIHGVMMDGD